MFINFEEIEEKELNGFNGGEGTVYMKSVIEGGEKIMKIRIPQGASIGMHTHTNNRETEYILKGIATFVIDGREEIVNAGQCHFCPQGSSHSLENKNEEDLVLFAIVC